LSFDARARCCQNGKWSANTPNRLEIQRNYTKDYEIRKQEIQHQKLKVTTVIVRSSLHCCLVTIECSIDEHF
jgi:hypothetical protein